MIRSRYGALAAVVIGCVSWVGCSGQPGPEGAAGPAGQAGPTGPSGPTGGTGSPGIACWDANANGACDAATEDATNDGKCDVNDCKGANGPAGLGYIALEKTGVVGFVRDTAGVPVVDAKVYLVPATDIPSAAIDLSSVDAGIASTVDEPLEDTIAQKGEGYARATTDANGLYRISNVAAGSYFLVAVPSDSGHLPGGSLCRRALSQAQLVGKQLDFELSTTPSPKAEYVGPSVCLNCHGMVHEKQTLHALGIRKIGEVGPLQDSSRFPAWNDPLAKFTLTGTTLYFFGYNGNSAAPDWKVSETNPGSGVSFTARLYKDVGGKYYVDLANVKDSADPSKTYEVSLSYGGGLYKQRYLTMIAGSRYVLPIQFNTQGQSDESQPYARWTWQHYNAQNWYDETTVPPHLKTPAKTKSFDSQCAGCHFSGFALTGDATNGFKAHGVPDVNGDMDYDGDGKPEMMNVSCETCHGPGSEHWQRAGNGRAIITPRLLTPEREVQICAQCHTRTLGIGGGASEAPMNASGQMMRAGTSRKDFLANYVSKFDDALWDATKGDGNHSKKHHQQASDFLKTKKYRNPYQLVTCSSCHDLHGNTGLEHQLHDKLDSSKAGVGEGLCMNCHSAYFPAGANLAARQQAHWASKNIANVSMGDIGCSQCHMPKTAKSGSGLKQATIAGTTYYSGDMSSHLFRVPLRASIPTKAADMMAIPYTNACATCHLTAP